eukprot:TRINITY_DN16344_c0_g1_i1.p1 TRINITY_DN16344_c0_g1~~TRINITY_DN16344_c0_g1_i1.p1  ORF type:complete len:435 (-),score=130.39 TRINITY_DN16344_c0_g1_i1:51-1355(-)
MNFINGIVSNIAKINSATLSGAVDVVFVEQDDGTFRSTPFQVRFGKMGVVWSKKKIIDIEINGKEVDLKMVLDDFGVAYFEDKSDIVSDDEEITIIEAIKESKECPLPAATKPKLERQRSRHASDPVDKTNLGEELAPIQEDLIEYTAYKANSNPNLNEIDDIDSPEILPEKSKKNVLELYKEELFDLNLNLGSNEVVFSTTSQYQGTTRSCCNVFVWQQSDKIIISDIDGTITKSDVRGMILPLIGVADWAQGEVTNLYSKISENGYKILYLSARSISQSGETKAYLKSLNQGNLKLPLGPLFLNPESAFKSFKREVIDRQPEIFKIECLSVLKGLFGCPSYSPYFAGYGNRPNDVTAYQAVGIPLSRIFIINKRGNLKGQICHNVLTSYKNQCSLVDLFFPPVESLEPQLEDQTSLFQYWKDPLPDVDLSKL